MKTLVSKFNVILLILIIFGSQKLLAATITVTSIDDNTNTDSMVTLREAIQAAETDSSVDGSTAGSGVDSIIFDTALVSNADAVLKLTLFDTGIDSNEFGPTAFQVNSNITVVGPSGEYGITIERSGSDLFRLFHVQSNAFLRLENLNIRNFIAKGFNGGRGSTYQTLNNDAGGGGGGGAAGMGGVVFNQGTLEVIRSTLFENSVKGGYGNSRSRGSSYYGGGGGGGVGQDGAFGDIVGGATGGGPNGGDIPDVSGNGSPGGFGGGGGGAAQHYPVHNGGDGGFGGGGGGGSMPYWCTNSPPSPLGGKGGFGGGGGGIGWRWGSCPNDGGGPGGFGGGRGAKQGEGYGGGGAGMGGAVFNYFGLINVRNSTFSGNSAEGGNSRSNGTGDGHGGSGLGGSIFNYNGNAIIDNCTFANNVVIKGRGLTNGIADGSDIFSLGDSNTAVCTLNNTILVDPISNTNIFIHDFVGLGINTGSSTSSGHGNLIETYTNFSGTVVTTSDPGLVELEDNGGPTLTYALQSGSTAIDAGTNVLSLTTDQRGAGFYRIIDGDIDGTAITDIGAFELQFMDYGDAPDTGTGTGIGSFVIAVGSNNSRVSFMGANGDTSRTASRPHLAFNATDYEYLVVWYGDHEVNSENEIYGQRIDAASGTNIGSQFRISYMGPESNTSFFAYAPRVAWNSVENNYMVIWRGDDNTAPLVDNEHEIFGRIISSTGTLVGSRVQISHMGPDGTNIFGGFRPDLAYNATDNQYLVVWYGDDDTPPLIDGETEIFGKIIDSAGAEVVSQFRISYMGNNGTNIFYGRDPRVAWNSLANSYMVVWDGTDNTPPLVRGEWEIFGQLITSAGSLSGSRVRISEMGLDGTNVFRGEDPDIVYNTTDNQYLIVWRGVHGVAPLVANEYEIFGEILSSTASTVIDQFRVSDMGDDGNTDSYAGDPAATYNPVRNSYLVIWRGDDADEGVDNKTDIYAQHLSNTGVEMGGNEFIAGSGGGNDPNFDQYNPAAVFSPANNEYMLVWHGEDDTAPLVANEIEIFGQRLVEGNVQNYNTFKNDNGPSHAGRAGLQIGALLDPELDGYASLDALGDDSAYLDDEDGVISASAYTSGEKFQVEVAIMNNVGEPATINGWVDHNADGVFAINERVQVVVPSTNSGMTQVTLDFGIVPMTSTNDTFMRLRLSTDLAATNSFGQASDGEVEDVYITWEISSGLGTPIIAVTNLALFHEQLSGTPVLADVVGTANRHVVGQISWWNMGNVTSGFIPATQNWTIADIPLVAGVNEILFTGTNQLGDSSLVTRYVTWSTDCDTNGVSDGYNPTNDVPEAALNAVVMIPFEEGTNTLAADRVGNHDGTLVNGVNWTVGRWGNAIELDGNNDYVSIADDDAIDFGPTNDFAISIWTKIPTSQVWSVKSDNDIVEKWSEGGEPYPYVIRLHNQNSATPGIINAARYDGTGGGIGISSSSTINDDNWHHIVFTRDFGVLKLYIDGVLEASTNDTTTASTSNNSPLYLGRRGGGQPNYVTGRLDEFAIFGQALTPAKVYQIYSTGLGNGKGSNCEKVELSISKTVDNVLSREGFPVSYTVIVTNNGPDSATHVEVTDRLPAGVTISATNVSQGTYHSGSGLWEVGTLSNGAVATMLVSATVDAGTFETTITNIAALTSVAQTDTNSNNDIASAAITVSRFLDDSGATPIHYVSPAGGDLWPYTNWATAATSVQNAIDTATANDLVLVTNGVYLVSSAISVDKSITLSSVNGPATTVIRAAGSSRCVNLGTYATVISGFTITNGNAGSGYGGGVYCANTTPIITNCTFSGNNANRGGGTSYGTINNCTISGNTASSGGGSYYGTINNCTFSGNTASSGGGSDYGTLNNCTISGNSAVYGGGTYFSTLYNCTISDNYAVDYGGGTYVGTINNCTISGNSSGNRGGGSNGGTLYNCIVYYNSASSYSNYNGGTLSYCCATPLPGVGEGNITNAPMFVDTNSANYRLQIGSPCIDAGTNMAWMIGKTDLDGNARVYSDSVDMGAYETMPDLPIFRFEKKIRFCGYDRDETLTNFPVLVSLDNTISNFSYSDFVHPTNGADLRFYNSSKLTELNYEIENWDTNGTSHVWVQVDKFTSNSFIYAMWGSTNWNYKPSYTTNGATWNTGYLCVWHLRELDPSGNQPDATANQTDLTPMGDVANSPALIDGGQTFDGNGDYLLTDIPGTVPQSISLETWVFPTNGGVIVSELGQPALDDGWHDSQMEVLNSGEIKVRVWNGPQLSLGTYSLSQWHHVVMTFDNSINSVRGYVNGVLRNSATYDKEYPPDLWIALGPHDTTSLGDGTAYDGLMDEVRISSVARSANWLWATWLNVASNDAFNCYGKVEIKGREPFINITNSDVTVDYSVTSYTIGGTNNEHVVGSMNWTNSLTSAWGTKTGWLVGWMIEDIPLGFGDNLITVFGTNIYGHATNDSVIITRARFLDDSGATPIHYVSLNGGNLWPYTNWATAATSIQNAIDTATTNDLVLVTNGTYAVGGKLTPGYTLTNRIVIEKSIIVRSVNGADSTFILGNGYWNGAAFTNGPGAVRCAYLTNGAQLIGFTLSNGYTQASGDIYFEQSCGGALLNRGGIVSNCVVSGNMAHNYGGGVACYYGGGVYNCTIIGNSVVYNNGGGVRFYHGGTVVNSMISGNSANENGGGVYCFVGGVVNNSTISDNSAGSQGGGVYCTAGGEFNNSIIYYNSAPGYQEWRNGTYSYCCSPGLAGEGNITNAPIFVDTNSANYRLQISSPCIDAGTNMAWMIPPGGTTDLDGNDRIIRNTVDMGAYEFNGFPQIATNALIFPAENSIIFATQWTNIIWDIEKITDDIDATNLTISKITLHYADTTNEILTVTNNINNTLGEIDWYIPASSWDGLTNYVLKFEVVDSSSLTNSRIFWDNKFAIVPEGGIVIGYLLSVIGLLSKARRA